MVKIAQSPLKKKTVWLQTAIYYGISLLVSYSKIAVFVHFFGFAHLY